jgi:hypothetical protein
MIIDLFQQLLNFCHDKYLYDITTKWQNLDCILARGIRENITF